MGTPILTDDDLISSKVEYPAPKTILTAFFCRPKEEKGLAGLILIQEWWGLNDHIKELARRLAKEGYAVLAPDLYSRIGNVVTQNGAEAAKLMKGLSPDQTVSDLNAALVYLKRFPSVDAEKIGVVGFSMGGSYALRLACRTEGLRCAVPFYGEIPGDAELEKLSAPVLFFWGEADGWIRKEEIQRLKTALKKNKTGEIKTYPDAPHAFFNDTRREVYQPDAAKDAWRRTLAFLNRFLNS